MRLKDLFSETDLDLDIKGIAMNSDKVEEGFMFICIKGRKNDGHEYAHSAVEKGAVCIVSERALGTGVPEIIVIDTRRALSDVSARFHAHPSKRLAIAAVTGTNGKTTVTSMISHIMNETGTKSATIGTLGYIAQGCEMDIPKINPTTPDPIELNMALSEMERIGIHHVAIEATSIALENNRLDGLSYTTGVFTNLTRDHLDEHGDMETYKKAKFRLFENCRCAVINIDDPYGLELSEKFSGERLTCSLERKADLFADNIRSTLNGTSFILSYKGMQHKASLKLPGRYNIINALEAIGACLLSKVELSECISALGTYMGVEGRFEYVENRKGCISIVDYAHTPDGLEKTLTAVSELSDGRIITVFGCTGERDKGKRSIMGRIASELSDVVIITSDDPYNEDPMEIIMQTYSGVVAGAYVELIENRRNAVHRALEIANLNDIILVAGKGHEKCQIIGDSVIEYNDRKVILEYGLNK